MKEDKFIVKKPEECDFESISELLNKDFRPREVLHKASGLDREDPDVRKQEKEVRLRRRLLDGVSLIAVDKENGSLAGIAINFIVKKDDKSEQSPHSQFQISRPFQSILKFIEKLEEGHDLFSELDTDTGLELMYLVVKEKYSRQGIARKLTEETLEMAKKLEIKFVQSIPTSQITQHLFASLGFETRSEMRCKDFQMEDGSPGFPFAELGDSSRYVVKIL